MRNAVIIATVCERRFETVIICASIIFCMSLSVIAQDLCSDSYSLTDTGKNAYRQLDKEGLFALGGTGFGGTISDGEKEMDILLQERFGERALRTLATTNASAGGLYGLIGLKLLASSCFDVAFDEFVKLPESLEEKGTFWKLGGGYVARAEGCFLFSEKRIDVAKQIKDGKFDDWIKFELELRRQREEHDRKVGEHLIKSIKKQ